MLTFRITNIVFATVALLTILGEVFLDIPVTWYLLVLVAYSGIIFYGCYYIGSNFFIPVICSAETSRKEIALSFDDGPAGAHTPAILKLLWEHKVKAAFFCIGKNIPGNEAMLRKMADQGHVIGNHSYSHHFLFDFFSTQKILADLRMADKAVKLVTGLTPTLFRPPYGVTNPNLAKAIARGGYTPVGWNIRSMDTVIKNEDKLLEKVKKAIKPGAIILFHDTSKTTVDILPGLIRHLHATGYVIVRLDKMCKLKPYA